MIDAAVAFTKWLKRGCAVLGFAKEAFRSHSLRRGSASELLQRGIAMPNIMLFGRWASESACREYVRRGEIALIRLRTSLQPSVARRLDRLAAAVPNSWSFLVAKAS